MKSVTSSVMITSLLAASLLAASLLTFCAPPPAYATEYVACTRVAQDAGTLHRLAQMTPAAEMTGLIDKMLNTEHGKTVVNVAVAAAESGDVRDYIRTWHNACLKLTT